jgi:16S rRNA (guanine527-N7)-methyltransferase
MRPLKPASGWPAREVSKALDVTLDDETHAAIDTWLDALAEWNAKMDLTAAKDARALAWLMLADAMMLAKSIPQNVSVVDVGTGAGAPGLALAILRRDLRVLLCEPLGKRAAFLRSVIGTLAREKDIRLEPKRGDDLVRQSAASTQAFDVAISRATLPPKEWLALGMSLVKKNGAVWLMLAQEDAPTCEGASVVETLEYDDGAKKKLVRYEVAG